MKKIILIIILIIAFTSLILASEINFSKIKGWTAADTIDQYDSSNLWEYINGAADLFYSYGFQYLHSCEMSSGDVQLVVDIYNMGTPLNAFGMYKTESGDIKNRIDIGTEAVITSPNQSLLLKDLYYVKINIYEGSLTLERNKKFLTSIAKILPGSDKLPDEIKLLPEENIVPDSYNFTKESYLGLSELTNCLYTDYSLEGNNFQYFLLVADNEKETGEIWDKLTQKWKSSKLEEYDVLFRKIPYSGIVGVIKSPKGIFGVTKCNSMDELLEKLKVFI